MGFFVEFSYALSKKASHLGIRQEPVGWISGQKQMTIFKKVTAEFLSTWKAVSQDTKRSSKPFDNLANMLIEDMEN